MVENTKVVEMMETEVIKEVKKKMRKNEGLMKIVFVALVFFLL